MLEVLTKVGNAVPLRASRTAANDAPARRWSRRRTLAFIIAASVVLWGVIFLGIYGVLNLIARV